MDVLAFIGFGLLFLMWFGESLFGEPPWTKSKPRKKMSSKEISKMISKM